MKAVEFCCGYGGATAGLLANGLQLEAAYDIWPVAVEAHKRWHVGSPASVRDVSTIQPEELEGRFVWASLPCQPWSTANRTPKRAKAHPSYYSLAHFARQVQLSKMAILENVPGLLTEKDGQIELRELEAECSRLGLSLSINIIPAFWFGVPQYRRRAIIVIGGPMVLFSQPRDISVAVTGWAVTATEGKGSKGRIKPNTNLRADEKRKHLSVTTRENRGQGKFNSQPHQISATVLANRDQGRSRFEPTVRAARGGGRDSTEYAQSEQSYQGRPPEMCAELQGVPFEPIAHLPKTHQYTLIGNAVPPLFATGIVRQILTAIGGGK